MKESLYKPVPVLLALILWSAPGSSQAGELQLETHFSGQHSYDPTFDALQSPDVWISSTVGLSYGVGEHLGVPGLDAYIGVSDAGAGRQRFDGDYRFDWHRTMYLLGAEFGYDLTNWFRPFIRVTGGLARHRFSVLPVGSRKYSEAQSDFVTRDSFNLEFHTPFATGEDDSALAMSDFVRLGVTLGVGYTWQTAAEYDELKASGGSSDWEETGIDIGTLDANDWFWSVGATLRLRL